MDDRTWASAWTLLEERFGGERSSDLREFYRTRIEDRLSENDFRRAVSRILDEYPWRDEQPYGFPRPIDFSYAVRGDTKRHRALKDWLVIHDALLGPGRAEKGWSDDLSEAGKKALKLIGDVGAVKNVPTGRVNFLRKDFVKCYTEIAPSRGERLRAGEEPELLTGGDGADS